MLRTVWDWVLMRHASSQRCQPSRHYHPLTIPQTPTTPPRPYLNPCPTPRPTWMMTSEESTTL